MSKPASGSADPGRRSRRSPGPGANPRTTREGRELDYSDLALLMLRSWVGLVMLVHGANHVRTLDGTGRWLGRAGWRAPRFQAWLLSVIEIAIGLGMILGLMTHRPRRVRCR